jgi:hypothetical protein
MKKMLIAAAAVLAMSAAPTLLSQAQAAPAMSPFCKMAPAANQSWAEYYGCWGHAARGPGMAMEHPAMAPAAHPMAEHMAADHTDFCKLAAAANTSWDEHYGCWKHH